MGARAPRDPARPELWFHDPIEGETHIEVEKRFTFRMRGIGYWHPYWGHGSNHGELEIGRESIRLEDFEPTDFGSIHLQNLVIATMGDRHGVGVVEQIATRAPPAEWPHRFSRRAPVTVAAVWPAP